MLKLHVIAYGCRCSMVRRCNPLPCILRKPFYACVLTIVFSLLFVSVNRNLKCRYKKSINFRSQTLGRKHQSLTKLEAQRTFTTAGTCSGIHCVGHQPHQNPFTSLDYFYLKGAGTKKCRATSVASCLS